MSEIAKRRAVGGGIGLVAIIVALILLLGGSDSSESVEPVDPVEQAAADALADQRADASANERKRTGNDNGAAGETKSGKPTSADSDGDGELSREEIQEAVKTIPADQRREFARNASLNVLRNFGYSEPLVTVSSDAEVITARMSKKDACAVEADRLPEVKKAVYDVVIFARKVRLQSLGGEDLATYFKQTCKPLEIPTASGQVVYSHSGTGFKGSGEIRITAKRFTVSYANESGAMEIYVTKGKELLRPVVKFEGRRSGSETYAGPGTFQVTVSGSGRWSVKVYDGA